MERQQKGQARERPTKDRGQRGPGSLHRCALDCIGSTPLSSLCKTALIYRDVYQVPSVIYLVDLDIYNLKKKRYELNSGLTLVPPMPGLAWHCLHSRGCCHMLLFLIQPPAELPDPAVRKCKSLSLVLSIEIMIG